MVHLRDVFIPQSVRADPPPVELPRELLRKLTESGEIDALDLPPGVDRETVERVRLAYQQRPVEPVLDVLCAEGPGRLVVLGDPGAGKSTLTRYLALALTAAEPVPALEALQGWLPLVVELRSYAEAGWREKTFEEFLDHLHRTEGLGLPHPVLNECLAPESPRPVLVIFDGLDELFEKDIRNTVAQRIAGFAARYPHVKILVTSRHIGYQRAVLDGAGFAHFMLQDLNREQINEFTERWYATACPGDPGQAQKLVQRVTSAVAASTSVRDLAGNPLILTILAIIGRRRELPRDRRTVYEHAVAVLVEHWDPSKYLTDQRVQEHLPYLRSDDRLELLRLVARRMQEGHGGIAGNHIAGPDLISTFENYLKDRYSLPPDRAAIAAQTMLRQFRERNFILSRFGGEVYGFVHRTFLEYLAAADIAHRFNVERALSERDLLDGIFARRWKDPAWHEVLLLLIGPIDESFAAQAIDHLLTTLPKGLVRTLDDHDGLIMAVQYLGEIRRLGIVAPQSVAVSRQITRMFENYATGTRWWINLNSHSKIAALQPVVTFLGPHWAGRQHFFDWYGQYGPRLEQSSLGELATTVAELGVALVLAEADKTTLREWCCHQVTPSARKAALRALAEGAAGDSEIWAILLDRATEDPEQSVRSTALHLLARKWSGDSRIREILYNRATADTAPDVRRAAIQIIARQWPDPEIRDHLFDRATTDSEPEPRSAALQALAQEWPKDPEIRDLLYDRATADPEPTVRMRTLYFAYEWAAGDPEASALLHERASTDPDPGVRESIIYHLGGRRAGDSETLAVIRDRACADPQPSVRGAALQVLSEWRGEDPSVREFIYDRAITDPDPEPRSTALLIIEWHWREDPKALDFIYGRATADPHHDPRSTALQTLAERWSDNSDIRPLLYDRAAKDPHHEPRSTALQALAWSWGDPEAREILYDRATADPHHAPRSAALEALAGRWPEAPDIRHLLHNRATTDPHPTVRRTALQALAERWAEDPATRDLLHTRATKDPDPSVRETLTHWNRLIYPLPE